MLNVLIVPGHCFVIGYNHSNLQAVPTHLIPSCHLEPEPSPKACDASGNQESSREKYDGPEQSEAIAQYGKVGKS